MEKKFFSSRFEKFKVSQSFAIPGISTAICNAHSSGILKEQLR
jgi:hypothetical protein